MKRSHVITYTVVALSLVLSGTVALIISCGGSNTPSQMTTATVNTSISDPPTCSNSAPNGQFKSAWVTITKVTAHLNADAGSNDSGWQTLVDLTSAPKQIDLLSLANTTCVLTQLGSTTLPPGKYQQIRLYLLSNNPSPAPSITNNCGNAGWNCVVPMNGGPEELLLSSESQTGIKIPASQIASGGLTVSAGLAVDLDINFDTCASLVQQGNHKWRLKPVLHAGEVTTENNALSGTVVDANTQKGIPGATVSLEQPDSSGDFDVIGSGTITDASGNFSFCPLPKGATYDVVVTAQTSGANGVTYNATVTLNVPVGSAMGNIQMVPETTASSSSPATILGQVTSTSVSSSPMAGDQTAAIITISTFQDAGGGKIVTIPPFTGMASFTTGTSPNVNNGTSPNTCPTGTDCENYILTVPASNPSVGTFTQGQPTTYSTPAANSALYWVQAVATVPTGNNAGQADCTPSVIPTPLTAGVSPTGNQIQAVPSPVTQNFSFVSCTAGQ
jgi:Domain of unknown function (DUF4382)/Carboxypeptidase regulatory-like domain